MDISSTFQSHQFESIKKFLFEIDSFWCQPISHKWSFCFSNNANNSHLSEVISWNSLRFWIRVSNYDIHHRWRNVWWLFCFHPHTNLRCTRMFYACFQQTYKCLYTLGLHLGRKTTMSSEYNEKLQNHKRNSNSDMCVCCHFKRND